jgi:signal peptidase I
MAVPSSPPRQPIRENVENIAVVLAMVCLLRGFVAEAFVIPTGSMATTLHGANRKVACPQCGHATALNLSLAGAKAAGGWCMNCRAPLEAAESQGLALGESGDRIVALKTTYEYSDPQRWDSPVFKYPARFSERGDEPPTSSSRTNFIKRIVALPGEEALIHYGNILVRKADSEPFRIAAKPAAAIMATRRLVWDNDRPARDLLAEKFPSRWQADNPVAAEALDNGKAFAFKGTAALAYRHLLGGGERNATFMPRLSDAAGRAPQLITDFEAYNYSRMFHAFGPVHNWVGELTLEARLAARRNVGTVALELVQASRVCRCEFDLAARKVRLLLGDKELGAAAFPAAIGNGFAVRFANVDDHLVAWMDEQLVFGPAGVALPEMAPAAHGPTLADLRPARIVAIDADALVSGLKLYRDIHYTTPIDNNHQRPDNDLADGAGPLPYPVEAGAEAETLAQWQRRLAVRYGAIKAEALPPGQPMKPWHVRVPADGYFMLGDNSPLSSDARFWEDGRFAKRDTLLGKPVFVFWPFESPPWAVRFVH